MSTDLTAPISVPADATAAAQRLSAALGAAGFDVTRDFAMVRADVTSSGTGHVTVGRLPVSTAVRLAELVEQAVELRADGRVPQ